jgi:hypothetical protein
VSVADSLAPKPLLHTQLGMEARVGIEPTLRLLRLNSNPNNLRASEYRKQRSVDGAGERSSPTQAKNAPLCWRRPNRMKLEVARFH